MKTENLILGISVLAAALLSQSCKNEIEFDACGQIEATQITVSAESNGKILSLDIEEGDYLSENQIVGAIDSVQTVLQIQELRQRIEGARSRIVDIKRQGEPNRNQLASLEKDLSRYSKLLQSNAATQKQVDDLKDKIAILKAQIEAQTQSWERGNKGVEAEISSYEIQLVQREDQLRKCRITAPAAGTVLTKYAQQGESVTAGKPLFKLADMSKTYVRAYFTTSQLAGLKIGDSVTIIPDDGSSSPQTCQGRINSISSQAEFTPKNIQTRDERADLVYAVKVSVPNDGSLRLGMYAYIRK
ncbi:MAG: HlyD family efflux transporter periplasmic adaptor subunit [Bacteroidales bacterium]|nr:HlyD family efflux transporter periplasmic adaptor subunit [Candidatus Cryptobacteroides equifaecalis]